MRTILTFAVAGLVLGWSAGCHNGSDRGTADRSSSSAASPSSGRASSGTAMTAHDIREAGSTAHDTTTLTGTLQSAHTTSAQTTWMLVGDRSAGGMLVDISRVRDVAAGMDGKRVRITGHMVNSNAAPKPTIVADTIEAASLER